MSSLENELMDSESMSLGDPQNVHSPNDMGTSDIDDDEYYEDDDDEEILDANGEPQQKRRRKYINKACDNCRSRHSRCDGRDNCTPCHKKGLQCTYSAPLNRRGPVSERQLQDLITSLTKQIETEKKSKRDWNKIYDKPEGFADMLPPDSPTTGVPSRPSPVIAAFGGGFSDPVPPTGSSSSSPITNNLSTQQQTTQLQLQASSSNPFAASNGTLPQEGMFSSQAITSYLEAYQRYIARHISANSMVFEHGSAIRILSNPSEQRSALAFQTFAVLANGARVIGQIQASAEFASRARRTLGAVFDQTDTLVAQGLMILSYYMSGEAEADKTMYYLQLARKMCQHLKARSSDYYMLILMTIGFASPHPEEKLEVFTELKQRLGPLLSSSLENVSRNFTLTLAIISVQLELELAKLRQEYHADYPVMLQVLEKLEKMLASDTSMHYSKLGFRVFLEVIRAQCYCNLGLREMAVECTKQVSDLCKDPEFQYVPIGVLGGVAMMATIQLQENCLDLVREHIARMNKMAGIYPFVRLIANKLSEALQDKISKAYERINYDRVSPTAEHHVASNNNNNNNSNSTASAGASSSAPMLNGSGGIQNGTSSNLPSSSTNNNSSTTNKDAPGTSTLPMGPSSSLASPSQPLSHSTSMYAAPPAGGGQQHHSMYGTSSPAAPSQHDIALGTQHARQQPHAYMHAPQQQPPTSMPPHAAHHHPHQPSSAVASSSVPLQHMPSHGRAPSGYIYAEPDYPYAYDQPVHDLRRMPHGTMAVGGSRGGVDTAGQGSRAGPSYGMPAYAVSPQDSMDGRFPKRRGQEAPMPPYHSPAGTPPYSGHVMGGQHISTRTSVGPQSQQSPQQQYMPPSGYPPHGYAPQMMHHYPAQQHYYPPRQQPMSGSMPSRSNLASMPPAYGSPLNDEVVIDDFIDLASMRMPQHGQPQMGASGYPTDSLGGLYSADGHTKEQ